MQTLVPGYERALSWADDGIGRIRMTQIDFGRCVVEVFIGRQMVNEVDMQFAFTPGATLMLEFPNLLAGAAIAKEKAC